MSIFTKIIPHSKDNSLEMSSPSCKKLYGIKIRKLPIAKYIQVLKAVDNIPELIFGAAFPDTADLSQVIAKITEMDKNAMLKLAGRLLTTVPTEACKLLSELLDIPTDRLLNPDCPTALSLTELSEILLAFVEANDYSTFFTSVQSTIRTCQTIANRTQGGTGYNAG